MYVEVAVIREYREIYCPYYRQYCGRSYSHIPQAIAALKYSKCTLNTPICTPSITCTGLDNYLCTAVCPLASVGAVSLIEMRTDDPLSSADWPAKREAPWPHLCKLYTRYVYTARSDF